jgi:hypothetical protein
MWLVQPIEAHQSTIKAQAFFLKKTEHTRTFHGRLLRQRLLLFLRRRLGRRSTLRCQYLRGHASAFLASSPPRHSGGSVPGAAGELVPRQVLSGEFPTLLVASAVASRSPAADVVLKPHCFSYARLKRRRGGAPDLQASSARCSPIVRAIFRLQLEQLSAGCSQSNFQHKCLNWEQQDAMHEVVVPGLLKTCVL